MELWSRCIHLVMRMVHAHGHIDNSTPRYAHGACRRSLDPKTTHLNVSSMHPYFTTTIMDAPPERCLAGLSDALQALLIEQQANGLWKEGTCDMGDSIMDGLSAPIQRASECVICNGPASSKCSKCKAVSYCGRDHQKQHWKTHKKECAHLANNSGEK